jgi:hypothetical protein
VGVPLLHTFYNSKKSFAAQGHYLASDECKAAAKFLAFSRLWCIGKLRSRTATQSYDLVVNLNYSNFIKKQ